jgi:hypothetical protein
MRVKRLARLAAAGALAATMLGLVAPAAPASAAPLPIDWTANVKSQVGGLVGQTAQFGEGSFVGSLEASTGELTGEFELPPATIEFNALGLIPVKTTFEVRPTGPVTGTVDLNTLQVTATETFNIVFTDFTLFGIPGLDPALTCMTSTPITVSLSGNVDIATGATLSGTWAFPAMKDCGFWNDFITLFVSSPNNTIEGTFAPRAA